MSKATRLVGVAVTFSLLTSLVVGSATVAASSAPFRISGAVAPISGPDAFTGASVQRATSAQTAVLFTYVSYFVVTDPTGANAYGFSLEATTAAPVVATELAFDPTGHRQLIAVGTPSADSLQTILTARLGKSATDTVSNPAAGLSSQSIQLATLTRGHDFFGTFWTDPVGITVNDVVDEARFYYDGVHVSSLLGYDGRQWLSGNGWWEVHHSIAAAYNASHTLGWVQTNDHFRTSSWFPLPLCGTTDVYYSVNRVYAQPNGRPSGDVTTWQTGACGFLLSYTAMAFQGT